MSFGKFLVLAILVIVIGYFSFNPLSAPIKPDLDLQKLLAALGGIFVIVLLVERVTEIVISLWKQLETDSLKARLAALQDAEKKAAEALANAQDATRAAATSTLTAAAAATTAKADELVRFQAETKNTALLVGFTLSVVVCAAGVGLLGEVILLEKGEAHFLRAVDIVLTSGLIAGGSDAFHQFVRALETFFTKSKEKIEKP